MTLDNLLGLTLEKLTPDPLAIKRLLDAASRNLQDARIAQLSNENRFDAAYKAIMQVANAAVKECIVQAEAILLLAKRLDIK